MAVYKKVKIYNFNNQNKIVKNILVIVEGISTTISIRNKKHFAKRNNKYFLLSLEDNKILIQFQQKNLPNNDCNYTFIQYKTFKFQIIYLVIYMNYYQIDLIRFLT